jgi:hypothetical protein
LTEIQSESRDEKEERKRRERKRKENAAWRAWDRQERERLTALNPDRLPLRHTLARINKSRSWFYENAHLFDVYKDGTRLTVGVPSINRYNASVPPAKIGKQRTAT